MHGVGEVKEGMGGWRVEDHVSGAQLLSLYHNILKVLSKSSNTLTWTSMFFSLFFLNCTLFFSSLPPLSFAHLLARSLGPTCTPTHLQCVACSSIRLQVDDFVFAVAISGADAIALSLLKKSLRDQTLSIGRVLPDTVFQKSVP